MSHIIKLRESPFQHKLQCLYQQREATADQEDLTPLHLAEGAAQKKADGDEGCHVRIVLGQLVDPAFMDGPIYQNGVTIKNLAA